MPCTTTTTRIYAIGKRDGEIDQVEFHYLLKSGAHFCEARKLSCSPHSNTKQNALLVPGPSGDSTIESIRQDQQGPKIRRMHLRSDAMLIATNQICGSLKMMWRQNYSLCHCVHIFVLYFMAQISMWLLLYHMPALPRDQYVPALLSVDDCAPISAATFYRLDRSLS